jgi:predicted O-methyltransferase YrrM
LPWPRPLATLALDFNEPEALRLLGEVFPQYRHEYDEFATAPTSTGEYYLQNGYFEAVDAEVLYCLVRELRPRHVVEVGSGYSTLIARQALRRNGGGSLVAIDPEPRAAITGSIDEHLACPVQEVEPDFFARLGRHDILFIDSSHTVSTGGDVNYLFFEVLPRLRPGVLVHVHDIFLPLEYPPRWVAAGNTEQYLLLAFLSYNRAFEVLWPGSLMRERHFELLSSVFSSCTHQTRPGSFWFRRIDR